MIFLEIFIIQNSSHSHTKEPRYIIIGNYDTVDETNDSELELLQRIILDGRFNINALSQKMKKNQVTIRRMLHELERRDIILGYRATINTAHLGYQYFKVFLIMSDYDDMHLKRFIHYCIQHKNILYITKAIGYASYELELVAKTNVEFNEIMTEIKSKFGDIVKDYRFIYIYKVYRISYF
ncbi:MAG: Lrp/AsnC family transcriptional regulator [Nanoarchaeota archaeon]|nr:Lrp/AsnC family transcriptional regulator [Nanoarchaeota archaeon]